MIADIIKALECIDPKQCKLSTLKYEDLKLPLKFVNSKYLERPFAYEFYYQFRRLIEMKEIKLEENVLIQGEVDKRYQDIIDLSSIPDFLVHIIPSATTNNKAVIEFKMATNRFTDIEKDFDKLLKFKDRLGYEKLVEVLIGETKEIIEKKHELAQFHNDDCNIHVILYDINTSKAEEYKIKYPKNS